MKRLELAGQTFGRWTVIGFDEIGKNGRSYWRCVCTCRRKVSVEGSSLNQGNSRRCSTCSLSSNGERRRTHGLRHAPEYAIWLAMKNRCSNRKFKDWKYYGGRGIVVCVRWQRSFAAFYSDMGKRPAGRSIDRRDTNGNYTPRNCRWATPLTQSRNRRSCRK